jgi:hypothetical protein
MGLLEPHAGHRGGDDERRLTADATKDPVIVVHDLGHARAALAAARDAGRAVVLASPPAAAATLGPMVFREIVAAARAAEPGVESLAVLDCGDAAGLALAAVRAGLEAVSLEAPDEVRIRVAEIAERAGTRLLAPPRAGLDLGGVTDPAAALAALFRNA